MNEETRRIRTILNTAQQANGNGFENERSLRARAKWSPRALEHRNYRLFFSGQLLSLVGTWAQSVAQSWLVYRLTGSPVMLGLVTFAGQLPYLILAPISGVVADHFPRRKLILITQTLAMVQVFLFAGLTLGGMVEVRHIFLLALGLGIVSVFDMTAR